MANFINIDNSAQNFSTPLPFQHFTGDYATATTAGITQPGAGISTVNACDAACKNNSDCEFFKFSSGTCTLFNSGNQSVLSGIKINSTLRGVGMSNIYSTMIPSVSQITSPVATTDVSVDACEQRCNTAATCFVYGYNTLDGMCRLYGSTNAAGNVGASRDLFVGLPTIMLNTPTQVLKTLVFTGTASNFDSLANQNIDILRSGSLVVTGSITDFNSSGIVFSPGATTGLFSYTARFAGRTTVVSAGVNGTYTIPTISISAPTAVTRRGLSLTVTNVPSNTPLVMIFNGTQYPLTPPVSGTTWTYSQPSVLWFPGSQSITVAVQSDTSIVSAPLSVTVPEPTLAASPGVIPNNNVMINGFRYVTHTFTAANGTTFTPLAGIAYDVLIVGGGGGGGAPFNGGPRGCGGGGGGGVRELRRTGTVAQISIVVGTGGEGGQQTQTLTKGVGSNGGYSQFDTVTVDGGGGGAGGGSGLAADGTANTSSGVKNGSASGGGASHLSGSRVGGTDSPYSAGTTWGTSGASGFDGTSRFNVFYGGGGGGAGDAGLSGSIEARCAVPISTPDGGPGLSLNYTGTSIQYGAGGGGGINDATKVVTPLCSYAYTAPPAGGGGAGGGGAGGRIAGNNPTASGASGGNATGFGCGGGGAAATGVLPNPAVRGGKGSNGIVIIRYLYSAVL